MWQLCRRSTRSTQRGTAISGTRTRADPWLRRSTGLLYRSRTSRPRTRRPAETLWMWTDIWRPLCRTRALDLYSCWSIGECSSARVPADRDLSDKSSSCNRIPVRVRCPPLHDSHCNSHHRKCLHCILGLTRRCRITFRQSNTLLRPTFHLGCVVRGSTSRSNSGPEWPEKCLSQSKSGQTLIRSILCLMDERLECFESFVTQFIDCFSRKSMQKTICYLVKKCCHRNNFNQLSEYVLTYKQMLGFVVGVVKRDQKTEPLVVTTHLNAD